MNVDTGAAAITAPTTADLFRLAWPMTLKAIFLYGIVVVDGVMVAPLGEASVAAMGLAAALGGIILGVIFAFSHAMQIRTAQSFGADDPVFLKSAIAAGLTIGTVIGICGVVLILLFGKAFLTMLAPSPDIAAHAWTYLSIFTLVILGESVGQTMASYFNGSGRTKIPLWSYCLSVPINIGTSLVLIHGLIGLPAFGVAGAAMGSALAVAAQTVFMAYHLNKSDGHLRAVPGWRRGSFRQTLIRHISFALPIVATFVSSSLATHVCTLIYAGMSLAGFAAMALIAPWNMVVGQISMQWTQAAGIIVAQLLGRKASSEVLDTFLSRAWRGAFVAATVVAAIFVIICLSVDMIYPDLSRETRAILFGFLPILVLMQFPKATNAICGNTLRAGGETIFVMNVFLWSQWAFRVPAIALFVLVWELHAFWVFSLFLLEELLKAWPFHNRLWRGKWKTAPVLD